jgi:hypothetical protein
LVKNLRSIKMKRQNIKCDNLHTIVTGAGASGVVGNSHPGIVLKKLCSRNSELQITNKTNYE